MLPITTAFYAALATLIILGLAIRVVKFRRKFGVGLGNGEHERLEGAIRTHANAVENIPLALMLLAAAEIQGLNVIVIHLGGIALVVSRILHAQGLSKSAGKSFGRFYGTLLCWLVMSSFAVTNIVLYGWSLL